MKKNTILFGISIVNMVLFLIGMIILFGRRCQRFGGRQ